MRASLLLLIFLSPQNDPAADCFVAPGGKDSNPGTKEAPFATIAQARDFSLKPGSPALRLGFVPIDVSTVGPRKR